MTIRQYEPIVVAIALSLYGYNVPAGLRASELFDHFNGDCMDIDELAEMLRHHRAYLATELPFPTAEVYIQHALEKYGEEAKQKVEREREASEHFGFKGFYGED